MARLHTVSFESALADISYRYPINVYGPDVCAKRELFLRQAIVRFGEYIPDHDGFRTLLGPKYTGPCKPWFADHAQIFDDGIELTLIGQPYAPIPDPLLHEMAQFCLDWHLEAEVLAASWHFPGWTVAILFRKRKPAN